MSCAQKLSLVGFSASRFNYSVSAERVVSFYPEIRKYYPNLKDGSLLPGYAGIRPKLSGPGQPACDFVIQVCFVYNFNKKYKN